MRISIVIAILNSHKIVVRQIRYFKKMRLPRDVEIIFVDDGSNPPLSYETCGLRNFRILYTNDKRPWTQGLARNMGAKAATGDYLFFTDIDHMITREAIEEVLKFSGDRMVFPRHFGILSRNGDLIIDRKSLIDFGLNPVRLRGRRGFSGGFHMNTYAVKKIIFDLIGGYEPSLCTQGYHMGGKGWSEESYFNARFKRMERKGLVNEVIGPIIYHYPVSKFRTDGDNNPFGLFHGLSLKQVPQPMKT